MKRFDEKVQEDFLFFVERFQEAFTRMTSESDKDTCKVITLQFTFKILFIYLSRVPFQKWLDKLAIETYANTDEKQTRNVFLSQLILCMYDRKLGVPFNESPRPGPLNLDSVLVNVSIKLPNAGLIKENNVITCRFAVRNTNRHLFILSVDSRSLLIQKTYFPVGHKI